MNPFSRPLVLSLLAIAFLTGGALSSFAQTPERDPGTIQVLDHGMFGSYLADGKGYALYMFAKDSYGISTAAGAVLQNWPPLLVGSTLPTLGANVQKRLIGTTTRADGSVQLTYDGMPLYYWFKDQKPGDTSGQNVNRVWFLVAPDGSVTTTAP